MAFLVCGTLSIFSTKSISCGVQAGRPSTAMSFFHLPGEALGGNLIDSHRLLLPSLFPFQLRPFSRSTARAPRHSNIPAQRPRYPADQLPTSLSTNNETFHTLLPTHTSTSHRPLLASWSGHSRNMSVSSRFSPKRHRNPPFHRHHKRMTSIASKRIDCTPPSSDTAKSFSASAALFFDHSCITAF